MVLGILESFVTDGGNAGLFIFQWSVIFLFGYGGLKGLKILGEYFFGKKK